MKRGRRLNQADIAGRLGISVSTVSRALAGEAGISPVVRQDVQELARTLGYRGKRVGSPLASRKALAFVPLGSATSGLSGFYFGILEGMRSAATHSSLALDVQLIDEHALSVETIKRAVTSGAVTGLLLAGIDATDDLVAWCREEDLPVVLVNGSDPQMRLSSVSPANFYGAYAATQRLVEAGHRKILHFTQELRPTIAQRRRGFEAAAMAGNADGLILSNLDLSTTELAAQLIKGTYDVTGLFLWNDIVAVQVIEALNRAGQAGRYSIIGFDDLPIASLATPRLSTMHVNREAIGEAAIRLLRQQMEGDRTVHQLELGVTPIEGGTIHAIR
jgi:DNA-binding LacI/PurR family transcriptional regulator